MVRLLELVKARGLPLAIASGSSPGVLRTLLEAAGLLPGIGVLVSAEEVPRGKPYPDIFEETARRLGVPAHECVAIEDSRHGVEAAKRAFMRCIAVPYLTDPPLSDRFAMADLLFEGGMQSFDADTAFRWIEERLAALA
jgi:beta-phosphoglucomutase-like phosphatase (HAD superfamily)